MRSMPVKISPQSTMSSSPQSKIKNFVFWFIILIFGFWTSSFAASCYGTKMPQRKEAFWGLQTHVIFKRYLEDEFGKLRSTQHFLLLSYGIFDWLSLDLKGGTGNIKQHPVGSDEVDYPSNFAGGYGFRMRIYESKEQKTKVVWGFQHISIHPKSVRLGNTRNKAILDDWQVCLLASYNFGKVTPYLGTKWSRTDYIHRVENAHKRKMSDLTKDIGLVFGLDIPLAKKVWLNLEGQVFDVEAASVSLHFSF